MPKPESSLPDGDELTNRRKRILFRSAHRGMKEMDLILGGFARRYVDELDAEGTRWFEALLEESDNDLFDWITGKAPLPPAFDNGLMRRLQSFQNGPKVL